MSVQRSRWAALGAAVAVTLGAGGFGLAQAATGPGEVSAVNPITSCRLADTRPGGQGGRDAPLVNGAATTFAVRGTNGDCTVPSTATAVVVNVTGLLSTTATFLTVYPADEALPDTSVLNLVPGKLASNEIIVPLSADGKIKVHNHAGLTDVLLDVSGYYTTTDLDGRYDTSTEVDAKIVAIDGYTDAQIDALVATLSGYTDAEIDARIAAAPFAEGWHRDQDGDGFGDPFQTVVANAQPAGYVSNYDDCNDFDEDINPDAIEVPESDPYFFTIDDDCDGSYDTAFSDDGDGDGWGGPNGIVIVTAPNGSMFPVPPSGKFRASDCDDADPLVSPGGFEQYNSGSDTNCDGLLNYYASRDGDGDGFGDMFSTDFSQSATIMVGDPQPVASTGFAFDSTDCDDSDPLLNPAATEIAGDLIDQNCDELEDYEISDDNDGDGFGDASSVTGIVTDSIHSRPPGIATDCDDNDPMVHPDAFENPNDGVDQNCDGLENWSSQSDFDMDGYGDWSGMGLNYYYDVPIADGQPTPDPGQAFSTDDCNDMDPAINPGATETPGDGIDSNCNTQDDT